MNRSAGPMIWVGIISSTCVLLFLFQKILWLVVPFLIGLILYYLLHPILNRIVLVGISRETAVILTVGSFFLIVFLITLFLTPVISTNILSWKDLMARYLDGGINLLQKTLLAMEKKFSFLEKADLTENVNERISEFTNNFAEHYLTDFIVTLGSWLPSLLLAPFFAFFFLRDGHKFKKFICKAVPNAYFERTLFLLQEIDRTAKTYFLGLLTLVTIDTIALGIGLWIVGIASPVLLALIAAVFALIPFIGSVIGCVMVVLVAATDFPNNPNIAYQTIIVFILVRLLDDFVFMPLTIGRSLKMHPLLTILMIFVGGSVAGISGLMLVLPLLGVVMVIGETVGVLLADERLRARHEFTKKLKKKKASFDLI
jgi:predicted PurR-regulated permease PerM